MWPSNSSATRRPSTKERLVISLFCSPFSDSFPVSLAYVSCLQAFKAGLHNSPFRTQLRYQCARCVGVSGPIFTAVRADQLLPVFLCPCTGSRINPADVIDLCDPLDDVFDATGQ